MELNDISGVGDKTIKELEKLGIFSVEDLITYYPKRYFVLRRSDMNVVNDGDKVIVDGIVGSSLINSSYGKLRKISFMLQSNNNIFNVIVFNQGYLSKVLKVGDKIIVIGKYDKYKKSIVVSEIRKGNITDVRVESIYSVGSSINKKSFANLINKVLMENIEISDSIPIELQEKYKFMDKLSCIRELHNPSSTINYRKALQRLKYEELYSYFCKIKNIRKINMDSSKCIKRVVDDNEIKSFIDSLSFDLTIDQKKTIEDIKEDLIASRRMNRLVQGDVGSGKTIVAMIAVYINYLSGYQSAMMVPTEILANQHYSSAISLFKDFGVRVCLLTSNVKGKNRLYKAIENGEYDFVIGTQSLIQEMLIFKNLGLIITDEQHRFGVNQRKNLINKGEYPDVLSMSATPIPRTYALTIYGDMDVSSIKTKPSGRKEVKTYFKTEKEIIDVLKLMKLELDKGHQVYVVAPAIDGEDNELDNVNTLTDKMKLAFGKKYIVKSIHGKLDVNDKNKIMDEFEKHEADILISTTVIEVGVNVPNTSVIVIFNANNYGLSTLHQLRGRVGRGYIQSYCVLVAKEASERLKFLEDCNDGFMISEYDFKNRGEGDLFGVRQSGEAQFKLANVVKDFELLLRVKEDIENIIDKI